MHSISLEVVDLQGYLWLTTYFHYFLPGNLQLQTTVFKVPLYRQRDILETDEEHFLETRRWMIRHESPYPGYCRSPGRAECIPLLCNCETILKEWIRQRSNRTYRGNRQLLFKKVDGGM